MDDEQRDDLPADPPAQEGGGEAVDDAAHQEWLDRVKADEEAEAEAEAKRKEQADHEAEVYEQERAAQQQSEQNTGSEDLPVEQPSGLTEEE